MKIILKVSICLCLVTTAFAQFPRNQKIDAAEYFINTDPGEGNGDSISANYGYWEVPLEVINLSVTDGSKIYVRAKSTNGKWSAPKCIIKKEVFANHGATIQYGEYYINTDPGKENGTAIDFSSGIADITSLNLRRGDKIFTRVKDSFNRWSQSRVVTFNYINMHKAEYRIKRSGGYINPENMILGAFSDSSCVFFAYKNDIPFQLNDTIEVRYQRADGFYSKWIPGPLAGPSSVDNEPNGIPKEFLLSQNYPNPFNPTTTIKYALPHSENVGIKVFDILGREVSVLVDEFQQVGNYSVAFDASKFASGVYFYRIQAGSFVNTKKMMVIK